MELLAPAGNMECLKAAVSCGADAVYFAGKSFGARSYADNFSVTEIYDAAQYCRLRGVKSYVTVNTVVFDRERKELNDYIYHLADAGVDGVIVQDIGVIDSFSKICPDMDIHASTQMTIHNTDGVRALEKMGIKRAVLARELSEEEIRNISDNTDIELEIFVHGAMCMSYSGQCLMSSALGGRSGNRGMCAQPCRLGYSAEMNRTKKSYLSLKDMSLIYHLDKLRDMGVASLKIEGRMKGADYVSEAVSVFRACIDRGCRATAEEKDRLNRVFYRGGLTDGYFVNKKGPEMFAFDKPDNPYEKTNDTTYNDADDKRTKIKCSAVFAEGEKPIIELEGLECKVKCTANEILEKAEKNPADIDKIKMNLCKTGGTAFVFHNPEICLKGNPFVPIKVINELRREAIALLVSEVSVKAKKETIRLPLCVENKNVVDGFSFTASVNSIEQYKALKEFPFKKIDVPVWLIEKYPDAFSDDAERIVINPGVICKDRAMQKLAVCLEKLEQYGYKNLRAENIAWLKEVNRFSVLGGFRMNITNSAALKALSAAGLKTVCLSPELNIAQIRDIEKCVPAEAVIYGHLPLMLTENCVLKNMKKCPCSGTGRIYDRKNKCFYVLRDGQECRNIILNSVPIYMGDRLGDIKRAGVSLGQLMFTIENAAETEEICRVYFDGRKYTGDYTRLHFYKGVLQR